MPGRAKQKFFIKTSALYWRADAWRFTGIGKKSKKKRFLAFSAVLGCAKRRFAEKQGCFVNPNKAGLQIQTRLV
jgi:hypothetical protein